MNSKKFAIETFEIAEWNVLKAIFRLKPKDFEKQITPNLNPIRFLLGHLIMQMDVIFNEFCYGERKLNQQFQNYFKMGLERENEMNFPVSYQELIETFLDYTKRGIEYLNALPEEKFEELPEYSKENNTETINELIQRMSLHFLGHTGQIYSIKRELGKGGYFVAGVKKKHRDESKRKWLEWWEKNKQKYK